MSFSPEIVLGPPGTGKTTYLLGLVEQALEGGIRPERIGFVAFTKKAATEALERAEAKFGLTPRKLPYFRTLHSLAFRMLGMSKAQVLSPRDLREFGQILGLNLRGATGVAEGSIQAASKGDKALFISNLSRMRNVSLEQQWKINNEDIGWYELERVHKGLTKFKEARGLVDFTDMLSDFITRGERPHLELLVIDEAQDLSQLQWCMVMELAKEADRVVIAGDDDQAIFQWAGADVEFFVKMSGKVTVLNQSYRTPQLIQDYASKMIERIAVRRPKTWRARPAKGSIVYHTTTDSVDMGKDSWLVLARNGYFLDAVEEQCQREGLVYERNGRRSISDKTLSGIRAWEELRKGGKCSAKDAVEIIKRIHGKVLNPPKQEFYDMFQLASEWSVPSHAIWHDAFVKMGLVERSYMLAALRRGEKITKQPRIRLSTIHSAKGGEADNVILFSDMAPRTYRDMMKNPDNEQRVFYVGATRTRNDLHLVLPSTKFSFSTI